MATGHPTQATSVYDADELQGIAEEIRAAWRHLEDARRGLRRFGYESYATTALAAVEDLQTATHELLQRQC